MVIKVEITKKWLILLFFNLITFIAAPVVVVKKDHRKNCSWHNRIW